MFKLKALTKGISSVRGLLNKAPSLSSLAFPPQIQAGIKVAGLLGINVPNSPSALATSIFKRDIDKTVKGLQQVALGKLDILEERVKSTSIDKIDWLL